MWGEIIGGALSFLGQQSANEENARSSAAQMEFQERMSNTAHQREVVDLRAAGLNPILSAKLGGASSPSGSQYKAENALGKGVESANSARAISSAIDLNEASAEKARADAALSNVQSAKVAQDTMVGKQDEALKNAQHNLAQVTSGLVGNQSINEAIKGDILLLEKQLAEYELQKAPHLLASVQSQMDSLAYAAQEARNKNEISETTFGKLLTSISQISTALQGGLNAANSAKSLATPSYKGRFSKP